MDDSLSNIDILNEAYKVATQNYSEKIDIVHYQSREAIQTDNCKIESLVYFILIIQIPLDKFMKSHILEIIFYRKKKMSQD